MHVKLCLDSSSRNSCSNHYASNLLCIQDALMLILPAFQQANLVNLKKIMHALVSSHAQTILFRLATYLHCHMERVAS